MHLLDRLGELPFVARLVMVAGLVAAATGIGLAGSLDVEQASLVLLVAVVCCALLGRSWGLLGAVAAAALLNLAFTSPHWTLRVGDGDDTIALITFGLIAVTVGAIVSAVTELRVDAERRAIEADIAARERYELERAAEAAHAAAEISRTRAGLLSAVSHNLRTPLAAIQASSSALLSAGDTITEDERRELTEAVHDESMRLANLVAKLLDLGRIRAGGLELAPQAVDVNGVLQAAVHRLGPLLGDRKVSIDVASQLDEVVLDPTAFDQALTNLLENAIRYTPAGSPIELVATQSRGIVEFRIVDHGPGVPAEEQPKVFDEFYRAGKRSESEGTGLGLAIVKAVVLAHRGRVWVEDTEGGGATFVVRLPRGHEY
ncbi:MAG TPA: ATP-binding protein [Acidimicrobiia bacterium]